MDREQFLKELFIMYPKVFNEYNLPIWKKRYELLISTKIDFERLVIKVTNNWRNMEYPPSPPELKEFAKDFVTTTYTPDYKTGNACPPPPDFVEQVNKLRKKMSMENVL